ncbi:hypothetical protein L1049_012799 [Liquidambar formosana]|uniref:CS domain-containing protein n=1 Tax=Liquidambar formosana TaxID=63359 RepID=A0AAP0RLM9_LIQFO
MGDGTSKHALFECSIITLKIKILILIHFSNYVFKKQFPLFYRSTVFATKFWASSGTSQIPAIKIPKTTSRARIGIQREERERERAAKLCSGGKEGKQALEMAEKLAPEKRHSFIHNGQKVFEWDQTLEEVNMYITLPPKVHSKQFYCKIQSKHVEVGIKGNPPYLNHELTSPVKTDSSFWTIEDDIMHITLQKRDKGQTWPSPILGQGQLDPLSTDLEQKRLMLQRFQEENPGFDFSQAQFSGNCPDPRTFMGGIRSD